MTYSDGQSQEYKREDPSRGLASDAGSFREYGADTLNVFAKGREAAKAAEKEALNAAGAMGSDSVSDASDAASGIFSASGSSEAEMMGAGESEEGRGMHSRLEEDMAYGDPEGDALRQEESSQKPKKRRRRRKKHPFLMLLIFALLLAGAYYTLRSQLFTVTKIDVEGNRFYTKAQVIELSGLRTGYNLFEVKTTPARDAILADPYIKYCKIERVPRGTIRITVEERTEYAAVPYGDEYVLLDEDGLVLRISDSEPALPLLMGMSIIEMTPGSPLQIEQSYLLPGTLDLISVMDENDLYFKKIYFSTVIIRAYIYDNYYFEGTPANIIANMHGIRQLLEEHYKQGITRGVIKVGNNNYLAFSPQIN